jgi:hypothetical protein
MKTGELFDLTELRVSMSSEQSDSAVKEIVQNARLGVRFFYSLKQACGVLHCSYDVIQSLIQSYRLDAVCFKSTYKIPWWSLAEYILDPGSDVDEAMNEYIQSKHRRS